MLSSEHNHNESMEKTTPLIFNNLISWIELFLFIVQGPCTLLEPLQKSYALILIDRPQSFEFWIQKLLDHCPQKLTSQGCPKNYILIGLSQIIRKLDCTMG